MCICKLCNDVTEDLEHFLFHCLALTELRNNCFCCVQTLLNRDFQLYTLPEKTIYFHDNTSTALLMEFTVCILLDKTKTYCVVLCTLNWVIEWCLFWHAAFIFVLCLYLCILYPIFILSCCTIFKLIFLLECKRENIKNSNDKKKQNKTKEQQQQKKKQEK